MIKLIVTDLDGTLVHHHSEIAEQDIRALRQAQEAGIAIAIASGRMRPEIESLAERIGIRAHAISQNGAYVHLRDGRMLRQHAFDRTLALTLLDELAQTPFLAMLAAPDYYFVERLTPHAERMRTRLLAPLKEIPDARERLGQDLACGKMSMFGEIEALRQAREMFDERFGDRVDSYVSDIDCVDLMPAGVSKGAGIRALLDEFGLKPEEALCIGDSFNDVSMFAETPHSFAMGGSHEEVKARASHTTASVADTIAWALRDDPANV